MQTSLGIKNDVPDTNNIHIHLKLFVDIGTKQTIVQIMYIFIAAHRLNAHYALKYSVKQKQKIRTKRNRKHLEQFNYLFFLIGSEVQLIV